MKIGPRAVIRAPAKEKGWRKESLVKKGHQEVSLVGQAGEGRGAGEGASQEPIGQRGEDGPDWGQKLQMKEKYPGAQDRHQVLIFPFASSS